MDNSFLDHPKKAGQPVNSDCAGFTILETAAAMLVMFIAVLGSISLFVYSIQNNMGANDRELAMAVAQQQLERLRNAEFTDAVLNETGVDGVTSDITRVGRTYRVLTRITNANVVDGQPTLKTITVQVAPIGTTLGSVTLRSVRATNQIGPNR